MMYEEYDQVIAIDYAEKNVAIARLTKRKKNPQIIEGSYPLKAIKEFLRSLRGKKVLTIEETTTAQWLYCELKDYVDKIIICDPYHNRLLSSGAKNDKIDAGKLAILTRAGLVKEVFHTTDQLSHLRKLVSGYQDMVVAGVRFKNQKSALYRNVGESYQKGGLLPEKNAAFILERQNRSILENESIQEEYRKRFQQIRKKDKRLRHLSAVSGIGLIGSVKILSIVIDARRFRKTGNYLAYCGLVRHELQSGHRCYGYRKPRYCRQLKSVYKTAALSNMSGTSDIHEYYLYLQERGLEEYNARHSIARYIAKVTYGMLKSGTKYKPYQWRNKKNQ